jgi:phosphoglycolate phosphatase-like HAD superfamily hydrolase
MFKGIFGLVLALALIAASGCGSSSDPETMTKAEFAKQANKICAEATNDRQKVIAEVAEATNPKANQEAAQAEALQKAMPTYEKAAEQIDQLGAPKGEEKKVERLVEAMEEAAERAKADPHSAVITNLPFRKADAIAQELGLKECAV